MKCTCGHDEGQHQEMNGELACFVILNTDGNFNDYCQCMKYEPNVDKDAQLVALREAGEKMAERLELNRKMASDITGTIDIDIVFTAEDEAALKAWKAATK